MFTYKHIDAFRAVMTTGSVTLASQTLNVSQPSVSRLLNDLERKFGCRLFTRQSRGMSPTQEALFFFEEVEKTYGAIAKLEEIAQEISQSKFGSINIGSIAAFAQDIVPKALKDLDLIENNISTRLHTFSSRRITTWVANGYLDLGIVFAEQDLTAIETIYTSSASHKCLMLPEHALAQNQDSLDITDLQQNTFVCIPDTAEESTHKNKSNILAETSIAAANIARNLKCLALVDPFTAQFFTENFGMIAKDIRNIPEYRFAIIKPVGKQASQLSEKFVATAIREIEKISSKPA
ncbi:LysR family transcriptional regulator [Kiloniella sp. b19]|uniref:LysR family transcriptional regulator n=1 Tax=Kiloniella sp. GXU_MW_B19 TaxID=3141326 RepID=UPI0031D86C1E